MSMNPQYHEMSNHMGVCQNPCNQTSHTKNGLSILSHLWSPRSKVLTHTLNNIIV
jgi:hypothetical protein